MSAPKTRNSNKAEGEAETIDLTTTASPLTPTDAVDEAEIKKIEQMLADSELAGGSIRLERKGPADSTYQYCNKFRVDEGFDLDLIKRVWGGGDYKCKTFRSNGQMYKSFQFSIDYRCKGTMDMSAAPAAATDDSRNLVALAQIMKPDGNANNLMIKMMEQASSQNNTMLTMMLSMQQQSQQQMMGMMTAMATAFGGNKSSDIAVLIPVLTAMINKPNAPAGEKQSLSDLVQAMAALKELAAPGSVPKIEDEKETMFDKIIKYGGPVLAAVMTRQPIQMPGQEVQQLPAASVSAPDAAAPSAELPLEMKVYINMIVGAAKKNSETGTYADMIADNLDDQQSDILCKILQRDDWVEKLAETDQRVLNFVPWFTKLRNELLETYGVIESPNQPDEVSHAPQGTNPAAVRPAPVNFITIPGAGTGGQSASAAS